MKTLAIALAATSIAFATPIAGAQEATSAEAATAAQTMVTAKVNGMVCDFCARAVTKVFGKEDAVENVHVDLDNGEIHVTLKPGAEMTDNRVETLVKKSGYDLVSIERETA
jgi:copper chaperone CopZ